MKEIEKLYENSGIKKCNRLLPCPFENECEGCEYNWYPDFTGEKQLELIKLLLQKIDWIDDLEMTYRPFQEDWIMSIETVTEFADENPYLYRTSSRTFENGLARLVMALWQDLTDQEKEEIRNILISND